LQGAPGKRPHAQPIHSVRATETAKALSGRALKRNHFLQGGAGHLHAVEDDILGQSSSNQKRAATAATAVASAASPPVTPLADVGLFWDSRQGAQGSSTAARSDTHDFRKVASELTEQAINAEAKKTANSSVFEEHHCHSHAACIR